MLVAILGGSVLKIRHDALAKNAVMLKDFEACRKGSVVYMLTFPFRGEIGIELDGLADDTGKAIRRYVAELLERGQA